MTAPSVESAPPIDTAIADEADPKPTEQTERGPLLDLPEEQAAKEAERLWKLHSWFHQKKAGENKQCAMWRSGQRFVKLVAERSQGVVKITTPIGLDTLPPVPNKVEEQVRNVIATLLADPPRLEAEPDDDSPTERDAAQFATRFLLTMHGESGLNIDAALAEALDVAATFSSGFTEICHSPSGGGYVPLTIEARPSATTRDTAEMGEMPDGSLDTRPFVKKYVLPDNALSDSPKGAQLMWQNGLALETLTSNQVRFLPRTARGIADAKGVVIARFTAFGVLREKYPRLDELSPEQLQEVEQWTISDYKRTLPDEYEFRKPPKRDNADENDGPDDNALICTLTVYYKSHPLYPKGCYAVFAGGKYRLYGEELWFESEDGYPEAMDLPVSQMRWEVDADGYDPYGTTHVRRLGPLDEMRTSIFTSAQEFLYRFSRPRMSFPMGTTMQPEDMADWDKPLSHPPGSEPKWFPLPQYPQMGTEMLDRIDADLEDITGIAGPALGQAAGSVRSAEQQNTLIERATIAVTAIRNNAQDYIERLGRLILQAARKYYTVPQLMAYRAQDGAYQAVEFTRVQLGNTKQVRVQRGTFTMMTPIAKNDAIGQELQYAQIGASAITPQEAARLRRDNIALMIGVQDNPHVLRVRRQVQAWRKGPPPEIAEQQPQPQMGPDGQPMLDPMTGQPVMTDPVAQAAMQVFQMLPCDEEQQVAILRHQELSDAVADVEFYNFPPAWSNALMQAYLQARQLAGIQTIPEQQQAAAQQQQAQAQQQQQQADGERQAKAQEKEGDRAFTRERDEAKAQETREREQAAMAARAAGAP